MGVLNCLYRGKPIILNDIIQYGDHFGFDDIGNLIIVVKAVEKYLLEDQSK